MTVAPQNLTLGGEETPTPAGSLKIGVLALQGAFLEHANMLRRLGATPVEVRLPADLTGLDGLIIPGGESTTIGKLASQYGLLEPLRRFIEAGRPVLGTCAGLIFLAKDIGPTGTGGHVVPPRLAVMDITVDRNAFGRQVDSFEANLQLAFAEEPFPAVFIRAPKIEAVGQGVDVLAQLEDGSIVAVRQTNLMGTAFHPELTQDPRFHQYFLAMVQEADR
ncbi:MAG TPA: pyridoxal 5'-phosphate synthase glutaminase subunit PdxT [Anaerolineae bacterium]|nr:pyridoxal 5'-phosphate synthase glutaminase subunit PdxT [Anaerolineae bacterium]HMR66419.1 pyridoxal 5'-phosphate synthase glutaminase subunit PdxT [Anaerolineae bacterium]